jgi:hypothetical protein
MSGKPACERHMVTVNVVLPATPMRVQVLDRLEWARTEASMQTRARSTSAAPPPARPTVAPSRLPPPRRPAPATPASRVAAAQVKNVERMRISYAAQLAGRRTEAELLLPLLPAFRAVKASPRFTTYENRQRFGGSWEGRFGWLTRAIAPAMMVRPIAEEVRDGLRSKALLAGVADKVFADRYFFELSLYCEAVIEKQDIEFIYGQASQILGPLLAPVTGAVRAALPVVGGLVATGVKSGANIAAKKGIEKAVVSTPSTASIPTSSTLADPMRFTMAWLDFVTTETEPADAIATIVAEFGGRRGCASLHEWLYSANL